MKFLYDYHNIILMLKHLLNVLETKLKCLDGKIKLIPKIFLSFNQKKFIKNRSKHKVTISK